MKQAKLAGNVAVPFCMEVGFFHCAGWLVVAVTKGMVQPLQDKDLQNQRL
jgi:hypothetical protein